MLEALLRGIDVGGVPAALVSAAVVLLLLLREVRRGRRRRGAPGAPVPPPPPSQDRERPSIDPETFRAEWASRTWAVAARRVLVVEDNESLGRVLASAVDRMRDVEERAYAAAWVPDGAGALEARDRDPPPDLYVVDLFLPDMSGMTLVERLRESRRSPILLIISGQGDQRSLDLVARACGADAAMAKPFDVVAFEQMVKLLFDSAEPRRAG